MNGLKIEKLPETKDIDGAKRWDEERGEFAQISYQENIGHLAFFQIREGFFSEGATITRKRRRSFTWLGGGFVHSSGTLRAETMKNTY